MNSYLYDPHINPTFDSTRKQIQNSINNLEEKLKKRKALQQDLIRQQKISILNNQYQYQRTLPLYLNINSYQQPLLPSPAPVPTFHSNYDIYKRQLAHQDYLNKINQLKIQREILDRNYQLQKIVQKQNLQRSRQKLQIQNQLQRELRLSRNNNNNNSRRRAISSISPLNYQDQILIKKYQDGTRARQYTNQLDAMVRDIQRQRSLEKIGMGLNYLNPYIGLSFGNTLNFEKHVKNYQNLKYQQDLKQRNNYNYNQNYDKAYQIQNQNQKFQTPYHHLKSSQKNLDTKRNLYPQYDDNQISNSKSKTKNNTFNYNSQSHHKNKKTVEFQKQLHNTHTINFNNPHINQALEKQTPRKFATIDHSSLNNNLIINERSPYAQFNKDFYRSNNRTIQEQSSRDYDNLKAISPYKSISARKSKKKSTKNKGQINKSRSKQRSRSRIQSMKKSFLISSLQSKYPQKTIERSTIDLRNLQTNALKKIQNRLKLSTIVYQDSKFRNIKHELNHLFSTYDNQQKIRKDLKDKFNGNQRIIKRYGLVID